MSQGDCTYLTMSEGAERHQAMRGAERPFVCPDGALKQPEIPLKQMENRQVDQQGGASLPVLKKSPCEVNQLHMQCLKAALIQEAALFFQFRSFFQPMKG